MYVDYSLVLKSTITFYMTNSLFSFRNQKKEAERRGLKIEQCLKKNLERS